MIAFLVEHNFEAIERLKSLHSGYLDGKGISYGAFLVMSYKTFSVVLVQVAVESTGRPWGRRRSKGRSGFRLKLEVRHQWHSVRKKG